MIGLRARPWARAQTGLRRQARIARSTVQDYLHRIAASGLDHEQLLALDDKWLDEKLFPPRESRNTARPLPDWEMIELQLRGRGVTLRLLWQEYQEGRTDGYQYTQFLRHFRVWQQASRPPVMRQVRRAGAALRYRSAWQRRRPPPANGGDRYAREGGVPGDRRG